MEAKVNRTACKPPFQSGQHRSAHPKAQRTVALAERLDHGLKGRAIREIEKGFLLANRSRASEYVHSVAW